MKILSAEQISWLDKYTIEHEPIFPIDLMERASLAFTDEVVRLWSKDTTTIVFAGPGNNGGDALAVARLLAQRGYGNISVYLFNTSGKLSPCCSENLERLQKVGNVEVNIISSQFTPPNLTADTLVIDGLFGTGLSRPLNGGFASVVKYINASRATVVSIDVPSGMMCEDNTYNVMSHIIHAQYTFTFHCPKLAFLLAENEPYVGKWKVLDIGIVDPEDGNTATPFRITERTDIEAMMRPRPHFAHKGTMGHAALIAGKRGMAGAAILSAKACMRTGVGKLTVHTPEYNLPILQISVPEAIVSIDQNHDHFAHKIDTTPYDAVAIGPGIGCDTETAQALIEQVCHTKCNLVLDADALNILGSHRGWINQLPQHTILTPHPKELFGIIGSTQNQFEQLCLTRQLAMQQHIYILIKGAYTAICTPSGDVTFNPTGNPGMATAGSGDVLTGIILGLLARDYTPEQAVTLGTYLHGLAGDCAAQQLGEESLIASDIITHLPEALQQLYGKQNAE